MSDQNSNFCFTPEELSSSKSNRPEEKFAFFLKLLCSCALCVAGGALWLTEHKPASQRSLSSTQRDIQNLPTANQEAITLEPFLTLLKSDEGGGRLTKIEMILQAEDPLVLQEVQKSSHKIRNHLIFILSKKNVSVFNDPSGREDLKQEIISQLNLFLKAGPISNLILNPIFLN